MAIDEIAASKIRRRAGNQSTLVLDADASFDFTAGQLKVDGANVGAGGGLTGWYDVTEAPYLAAGDGTTDDTAAIQAAIDAAADAGGGTVYFPPGTYLCDGADHPTTNGVLEVGDYTELRGAGRTLSCIKLADGVENRLIANKDADGVAVANNTHITLRSLEIDGNRTNQATDDFDTIAMIGVSEFVVEDCYIHAGSRHCIWLSRTGDTSGTRTTGARIAGNKIGDCGSSPFSGDNHNTTIFGNELYESTNSGCKVQGDNNTVIGNNFHDNGSASVYVGDPARNTTVVGNTMNACGEAIRLQGGSEGDTADDTIIANNYMYNIARIGIRCLGGASRALIANNYIYSASNDSTNTYDAIYIVETGGVVRDMVIRDNVIIGNAKTRNGIRVDGGTPTLSVASNVITGTASAAIVPGSATFIGSEGWETLGSDSTTRSILFTKYGNDIAGAKIDFYKTRGTTQATHSAVLSGNTVGSFRWWASDGDSFENVASIDVQTDGSAAAGSVPGRIKFNTTPAGSATAVERVRIPSDGGLAIQDGITAPAAITGMAVIYVDGTSGDLSVKFGDGTVKVIVADT
jgi:hypothetical protein